MIKTRLSRMFTLLVTGTVAVIALNIGMCHAIDYHA